jgi:hypothetical protein
VPVQKFLDGAGRVTRMGNWSDAVKMQIFTLKITDAKKTFYS